uniref:Uncharacterized protein n=1 Tax=candidate division WOR-3 bacterium TaxID=2052148 RepID=A0A7C4U7X9_UNCW3
MKKFLMIGIALAILFVSCDWFKSNLGATLNGTVSGATGGFVVVINNITSLDSITTLTEQGLKSLTTIIKGIGLIGSNGSYEVLAIPAGSYYVLSLVDGNGNGTLDSTDQIGWYGTDTTFQYVADTETLQVTITKPSLLTFEEKEKKTGCNITRLISKEDFQKYYDYITK